MQKVEIGPVILEKKIFKFRQCIFTISYSSPLGKGYDPSFEHTWILFTLGCFVPRNSFDIFFFLFLFHTNSWYCHIVQPLYSWKCSWNGVKPLNNQSINHSLYLTWILILRTYTTVTDQVGNGNNFFLF